MLVYSNPNPILIITLRADPAPRLHSGGWRGGDDVSCLPARFSLDVFPFFSGPQGEERGGEWGGGLIVLEKRRSSCPWKLGKPKLKVPTVSVGGIVNKVMWECQGCG